jgi:hypothetical protein
LEGEISNNRDSRYWFKDKEVIYQYSSESGYGGSYTDTGQYRISHDTIICNFNKTKDFGPYGLRIVKKGFFKRNRKKYLLNIESRILFNPQHSFMGGHYYVEELTKKFNLNGEIISVLDSKNNVLYKGNLPFGQHSKYISIDLESKPSKILINLGKGLLKEEFSLPKNYNEYYLFAELKEPWKFGKPAYLRNLIFLKTNNDTLKIDGYSGTILINE